MKVGDIVSVRIFRADDSELSNVMLFLEGELEEASCPMKALMQLSVCTEEIFVNTAHYAYPEGKGEVEISVESDDDSITVTFADSGKEFNPLSKDDPDITLSADERQIGGLGIFMVKKSMDEVRYERRDGKNIFSMKKMKG